MNVCLKVFVCASAPGVLGYDIFGIGRRKPDRMVR